MSLNADVWKSPAFQKQSSVLEQSKVTQCQIQQIYWMVQNYHHQFFGQKYPDNKWCHDHRMMPTFRPLPMNGLPKPCHCFQVNALIIKKTHWQLASCNYQSEQHPRRGVPPEFGTVEHRLTKRIDAQGDHFKT
jgi:hypothetical protein